MTTLLPTVINQDDVKLPHTNRSSLASTTPPDVNACLMARIGWCHRQALKALTTLEVGEWYAEKQGLIDALLQRDCTYAYQDMPGLRERYAMGLQDGVVLIQAARIRHACNHRYHNPQQS